MYLSPSWQEEGATVQYRNTASLRTVLQGKTISVVTPLILSQKRFYRVFDYWFMAVLQVMDSGDIYFASVISALHATAGEFPTNQIMSRAGHMLHHLFACVMNVR